jgi:hypothetical protein
MLLSHTDILVIVAVVDIAISLCSARIWNYAAARNHHMKMSEI